MKAEEAIGQRSSGRAFQRYNRKVRPVVQIGDVQKQFQFGIAEVELGRSMGNSGIKFNRRFSFDTLMRTEFIVPRKIKSKLMTHVSLPQRHDDLARAFGFQGANETLYNGNTAVFADCAVTRSDFLSFAPILESMAEELRAFIADDVSWSFADRMDGSTDERTYLDGSGLVIKNGKADDLSGEMVNDDGHPIGERPALRQGEREPGRPEAVGSWDNGQVNMPDVIGIFCRNNMLQLSGSDFLYGRRFGFDCFFKEASDGRGTDFAAGDGEEMSESFFTHERAEDFKALDDITDEIGMFIDGHRCLNEDIVIGAFEPGRDRVGINHENAGGLGDGPAIGGHYFKNELAFMGQVICPVMRRNSSHAGVLDVRDFFNLRGFGDGLIALGSEPDALDGAVGGPGTGIDEGKMSERNDVENDLPDVFRE